MPVALQSESRKLDEITIRKEFDINAALDSIKFYWNLARHRGEPIVVEVWSEKPKPEQKGGQSCSNSP